jgi:GT2 family glycosyltransferase/predicted ATP-grasp superfamily ATP-dependent carboligase
VSRPDVSVSIVNTSNRDLLLACLESLERDRDRRCTVDVVVLDNASEDGSAEAVRERFPAVRVIAQKHRAGFGANHNTVIRSTTGRYVYVLNEDTTSPPGSFDHMVAYLDEHPRVGALGPRILYPDGRPQASAWRFPTPAVAALSALTLGQAGVVQSDGDEIRSVDWAMGCALLVRRSALDEVGLFDERFFIYSEETDLCRRLVSAGYEVHYFPHVTVFHHVAQTSAKVPERRINEFWRSRHRYWAKHHSRGAARAAALFTGGQYAALAAVTGLVRRLPERARPVRRPLRNPAELWLHARNAVGGVSGPGLRELAEDGTAPSAPSPPGSPALVVDVGWVNGLAAIRSLGRAGIEVLALDHRRSPLGFRSRFATRPISCPDPATDEEGFVSLLSTIGAGLDGPAPVFPTHDPPLNAIARHREALSSFLYPFPPWSVLQRIQDKRRQLETAVEAGVHIPETRHPQSAQDAVTAAEELGYPVLVKPRHPDGFKRRFGRQAFRCETSADVERSYAGAEPFGPMVQELVPGGDDELYSLGSYLRENGDALGLFCGRKLRQTPPGIGTCRIGEAVWVEDVVQDGLRLLRALGYYGISQVEFKRDPRDGRYKLMEVNPRLWQWHSLATACGVDLPLIAYCDLTGQEVAPASMNGERRRWAITLLSGESPAVQRPPYVEAVFSLDDPKPGLVHAARLVRGALR